MPASTVTVKKGSISVGQDGHPARRLAIGTQLAKLPHKKTVPCGHSASLMPPVSNTAYRRVPIRLTGSTQFLPDDSADC